MERLAAALLVLAIAGSASAQLKVLSTQPLTLSSVAPSPSSQLSSFRRPGRFLKQTAAPTKLDIVAYTLEITTPPGDEGTPPHHHPGPVLGYIIEGEMLFQLKGSPIEILSTGQAFSEKDGDIHVWGGNASKTTQLKFIAIILGRPGQDFLTMNPEIKRESYEEALKAVGRA